MPVLLLPLLAALLLVLPSCSREIQPTPEADEGNEVLEGEDVPFEQLVYERTFAFVSLEGDSVAIVPWSFAATTSRERVERRVRGWLLRNGAWDAFVDEELATPPDRAPWRIVPFGGARLVVGAQDAVESLLFRGGARRLDLELGERLAEWSEPRGARFRVRRARASVQGEEVDGLALDLNRARPVGEPGPREWIFLVSGDDLQVVLVAPSEDPDDPAPARGWSRASFLESHWPAVELEWARLRPYEEARRDVPAAWAFRSADGGLTGEVEVETAYLETGEAEGPISPVFGLFEVRGRVTAGGREFPVVGLVRHAQR